MSIYCCSDLHGRYDLYEQINKFLKPEDKVICLGDVIDRGVEGYKLLRAIYTNPQWELIKGNHEDMFYKAACDLLNQESSRDNIRLHICNGGYWTLSAWNAAGRPLDIFNYVRRLPLWKHYTNKEGVTFFMSHSGAYHKVGDVINEEALLWDREHFYRGPEHEEQVLLHGHTPIQHLAPRIHKEFSEEPGAFWYDNDRKVCLDCGSSVSGYICLLDLDTLDEHIFIANTEE